jgi:hypothetical protein
MFVDYDKLSITPLSSMEITQYCESTFIRWHQCSWFLLIALIPGFLNSWFLLIALIPGFLNSWFLLITLIPEFLNSWFLLIALIPEFLNSWFLLIALIPGFLNSRLQTLQVYWKIVFHWILLFVVYVNQEIHKKIRTPLLIMISQYTICIEFDWVYNPLRRKNRSLFIQSSMKIKQIFPITCSKCKCCSKLLIFLFAIDGSSDLLQGSNIYKLW